jgi:opacity protein-like surface antigen
MGRRWRQYARGFASGPCNNGSRCLGSVRLKASGKQIAGFAGIALTLCGSSAAQADCALSPPAAGVGTFYSPSAFLPFAAGGSSAINSLVAATNTVNTAFLTQTNSFIGGPTGNSADRVDGGAWARGVGGENDVKATGNLNAAVSIVAPGFPGSPFTARAITANCATVTRETYGGYQVGQDIAKINLDGVGTSAYGGITAGYVGSNAKDVTTPITTVDNFANGRAGGTIVNANDFTAQLRVPFVGVYGALIRGNLFWDTEALWTFYQTQLASPSNGIFNQGLDAYGVSVNTAFGYHHDLGNGWFVEPSVGISWSHVAVDAFNSSGTVYLVGGFTGLAPPGTLQISDLDSVLGRVGVRVGTNVVVGPLNLRPFATATVWHEFAGNVTATSSGSIPVQISPDGVNFTNATLTAASTLAVTRVGTYGQFGAGVAAEHMDTGWLGYLRVDFREGANIHGAGVNAGVRYQFDQIAAATPAPVSKAPAKGPLESRPYDWTGFYVGGYAGSGWGTTDWNFAAGAGALPKMGGFLGGFEAGINYQVGSVVLGAEGDLGLGSLKGSASCVTLFYLSCNETLQYAATATGRVGYAWDRALLFAKGGAAWTRNDFSVTCNTGGWAIEAIISPCVSATGHDSRFGWTVGGGLEYALSAHWSAKAEYD